MSKRKKGGAMLSRFLKTIMPRGLYGRAAVILLLPMLTVQLATATIFIQRHYEDVTRQMTNTIIIELKFILTELNHHTLQDVTTDDAARLQLSVQPWDGQSSGNAKRWYDISALTLVPTLYERLPGVRDIDLSNRRRVVVVVDSAVGPISITFGRHRVSASNPHQLLVLMIFTGIIMTLLAFVFLRNQLRPIKLLARASEAFGRGQTVTFRPRGAEEVRAAGWAFLNMRDRIERHIEQRTTMLSGVSHDLKTPLTRLQLGLAMIEGEDVGPLKQDVAAMATMLDAYLAFARDGTGETYRAIDLVQQLKDRVARHPQKPDLSRP